MIKRINNEKEFLSALNRVDTLMFHAVPGTPEGDELNIKNNFYLNSLTK